jgi:AraC-like DNA-binding protein
MERLQRLHAAAGALAEDAPTVIANPETARALEQALIDAMLNCLGAEESEGDRAAQRRHADIMRRFQRVIDLSTDQPVYLPALCREIGASERTLRACCEEHLGMAPKRYLLLRRIHMVRRALRESTPGGTTVTEIATRYGFWQFGLRGIHAFRGGALDDLGSVGLRPKRFATGRVEAVQLGRFDYVLALGSVFASSLAPMQGVTTLSNMRAKPGIAVPR